MKKFLKILTSFILVTILFTAFVSVKGINESTQEYDNGNYPNIRKICVFSDLDNDYFISNTLYGNGYTIISIIKHNIKENTNETIYTYNGLFSEKQFVRDNVIYIEAINFGQYLEGTCSGVKIIGFNFDTNQVVYEKNYDDLIVRADDTFHSFVLDSRNNLYFEYDYTGIKVLDSNGNLIFNKEPEEIQNAQYEIVMHNVTPNDDGIIFSKGEVWQLGEGQNCITTKFQGYQKLNADGSFKYNEYTYFRGNENLLYLLDPDWKFIDNNYAINQYGELAEFTYLEANDSNKCGINIEIIDSTYREGIDSYYGQLRNTVYCIFNNKLYMFGKNGIIKVYDVNDNFKPVGKYQTTLSYEDDYDAVVQRITCIDNKIFIKYYSYIDYKEYEFIININDIEEYKNIWVTEFITQNNTQTEISEKYNEAKLKYDYSNELYVTSPTWSAPYIAGELKQGPIDDTISQLNFYRWLYGVNDVTARYDKMERSQKGAVVQAATNELTHTPSRPQDMDEEFYKEAYDACYVKAEPGDWYNGNCAQGDLNPADTIKGFIDELHNVSTTSSVGHRLNLLDLGVDKVSFGYCNTFTALSMYYDEAGILNNNEKFYTYPTAGNFPSNLFNTSEYISILCNGEFNLDDININITYNETTYNQLNYHIERENVIVFLLPDNLVDALGGKDNTFSPDTLLNIKVENIKCTDGDTYNLDYNIEFYDVENPVNNTTYRLGDINNDGEIDGIDCTILIRYLDGYENLSNSNRVYADINKDGEVDGIDCTILIRYLDGYESI